MFSLRIVVFSIFLLAVTASCATARAVNTYTSSDGTFTFQYPADWEKMENPEDPSVIILDNLPFDQRYTSPTSFSVHVSAPSDISQSSMMGMGDTPAEMVRAQAQFMGFAGTVFSAQPEDFEDGELEGIDESLQRAEAVEITEYTINGSPAARALFSTGGMFGYTNSIFSIVLEVGGNKVAAVQGISLNGEAPLVQNQAAILAIADSIRYTPLPIGTSGNPDLPQTFSGPIGVWDMGTLTFNYPDDWYVLPLGPFLQNTPERMDQANPLPGRLQVGIVGPEFGMMPLEETEDILECRVNMEEITAESVMEAYITVPPDQIEALQTAGITYGEPERIELDGLVVYRVRSTDPKRDVLIMTVDMGNGNVIPLMAFAPLGEMSQYEETLLDIVSTFEFTPNPQACPTDETSQ
jgi:hypothetical protein